MGEGNRFREESLIPEHELYCRYSIQCILGCELEYHYYCILLTKNINDTIW